MRKCALKRPPFFVPQTICLSILFAHAAKFVEAQSTTQSLNKKLGLYVFPAKNQSAEQTQKDESYCYQWAIKNSGVDPLNMEEIKPDSNAVTGREGEVVTGAAKGAAAGVAIGAIAGDAGKGAAIGAVVGGLAGRGARKQKQQTQKQQSEQKAKAATQSQIDNFTKAYKACLTGKGYTVQ